MSKTRDLTEKQFRTALYKHGFRIPAVGVMGYIEVAEGPAEGLHICRHNAGPRRRSQLAYLIAEKRRFEERQEKLPSW